MDINVAIVDDHDLLLEALGIALNATEGIAVVLAASTAEMFFDSIRDVDVDVVVTDLALGDRSGTEIAAFVESELDCPVLLITGQGDRKGVQAAVESGCAGFINKGVSVDELVAAIRVVADGGSVFPAALLRTVLSPGTPRPYDITDREMAVLQLLAQGQNAASIATELTLSVHTARNHIRALLTKLQAKSQLEAVVRAVRDGLVSIE